MSVALRIAVDARSLLCARPRGEGKSLLRLYAEMKLLRPELEPVFVGDVAAARYTGDLPPGSRVVSSSTFGDRLNTWENAYLPWAARAQGCQVLHCASSTGPIWSSLPSVLTVHDLIPIVHGDGLEAVARRRFERRWRNGMRNARRIIAVSEHTRQDIERLARGSAKPVDIIHWGSDPLCTAAEAEAPAATRPYVLAFGGEAPRKNTDYTLDRFIAVAAKLPELDLVLPGISNERQRAALLERAARVELLDRVHIPGFVDEAALPRLLTGARALLYLSLYEGFGLPVLESICRGVPVLASDRSSIPEILSGVPGCFALERPQAIENALAGLVRSPVERRQWAAAQARVLPRFSWPAAAARTLAIFDEVVARAPIERRATQLT